MRYTVIAAPDQSGAGYVAYVPAIPGCVTAGDDLTEALAMAQDAAAAMLAVAAERGEEIPTETPGAVVASVEVDDPAPVALAAAGKGGGATNPRRALPRAAPSPHGPRPSRPRP